MFAPYPRADQRFFDERADERMAFLMRIVRAIRNLRQTYDVPTSAQAQVILVSTSDEETNILKDGVDYIKGLAKANPVTIQKDHSTTAKLAAKEIVSSVTVLVPLAGLINIEKAKEKLNARKASVEKEIEKKRLTLDSPEFKAKAPKDKIEKLETELSDLTNQLNSIKSQLEVLDQN
jgi:valyl-tRNA synthetase